MAPMATAVATAPGAPPARWGPMRLAGAGAKKSFFRGRGGGVRQGSRGRAPPTEAAALWPKVPRASSKPPPPRGLSRGLALSPGGNCAKIEALRDAFLARPLRRDRPPLLPRSPPPPALARNLPRRSRHGEDREEARHRVNRDLPFVLGAVHAGGERRRVLLGGTPSKARSSSSSPVRFVSS